MHFALSTRGAAVARTVLVLSAWVWLVGGCAQSDEPATDDSSSAPATEETAHKEAETNEAETQAAEAESQALHKADPVGTYGVGIKLDNDVAIAAVTAEPETYIDRILQVRGTVAEVCPKRGCWIDLADASGETLRVKVTDGEIVFPLSAKGHEAVVEGIFEKIELDEEQHRAWKEHEAQERGMEFNPEDVSGPGTIWRLQGLGARIES